MGKSYNKDQERSLEGKYSLIINYSLSFLVKICPPLSPMSVLSPSLMVDNTTASSDKLTCTNYVVSGKNQDRVGQFFPSENPPNTWMLNLNLFERVEKKFAWFKAFQSEKQVSSSSCDWGISWSLHLKTLVARKTCHQCWYLQKPQT